MLIVVVLVHKNTSKMNMIGLKLVDLYDLAHCKRTKSHHTYKISPFLNTIEHKNSIKYGLKYVRF